ncbi:MAG TPA: hypothetical protein VKA87_01605 [Nitrososphaeraceae archaeon]|nr:hypothetical protein [Nitrososphaeraceae archaeon]
MAQKHCRTYPVKNAMSWMKTFLYKPPFGHADANIGNPPLLEVEALDDSGNEIQNFNYWHPLWAFQIREDGRGGLTILPNSEARIVTEFDPRIAETQISYIYSEEGEEVEGDEVISIDLRPTIRAICEEHPDDCSLNPSVEPPPSSPIHAQQDRNLEILTETE